MRAILSLKIIINNQHMKPITVDVTTDTIVANFASSPFPAPSSFATLTLGNFQALQKGEKSKNNLCMNHDCPKGNAWHVCFP